MKLPVLFIGHGSPMNALTNNPFTQTLRTLGSNKPKAVLCVSAHWMTEGSWVTAMDRPKTIHDFYGFPEDLFAIQYPAPGDPQLAGRLMSLAPIQPDREMWGLDHGSWSVLRHMFPAADVPVLQLSLHMEQPPEYHFELGQKLAQLREEGVLIVGSGNVVHNLRTINWETHAPAFDWALEYDTWIKEKLAAKDFRALTRDFRLTSAAQMSVPTLEHYLPLLYVIGAADPADRLHVHFEEIHNASISMRTFSYG